MAGRRGGFGDGTTPAGSRGPGCRAPRGRVQTGARPRGRALCPWAETHAQGTLEYAIVTCVFVAICAGCAALWRAAEEGVFARLAAAALSHALEGPGAIDIALF